MINVLLCCCIQSRQLFQRVCLCVYLFLVYCLTDIFTIFEAVRYRRGPKQPAAVACQVAHLLGVGKVTGSILSPNCVIAKVVLT